MTGGSYNGVVLNAAQYKQLDELQNKVWRMENPTPVKIQALEQQIKADILNDPKSALRPLLWNLLEHHTRLFSPGFSAQVYLLALSGMTEFPALWTPAVAAGVAIQQPLAVQQEILSLLRATPEASVPAERQEHFKQVERVITRRMTLDEQAVEPTETGTDAWIEAFLLRIYSGVLQTYESQLPPLPPVTQQPALLRKLLSLKPEEQAPGEDYSQYDRDQYRRYWPDGLKWALTPLLDGELSDEDKELVLRRFIEQESTPLLRMDNEQAHFDQNLFNVLSKHPEHHSPMLLAALRRSLTQASTYFPLKQLQWVNDVKTPELNPGEAWSDAFLAKLDTLADAERAPWPALAAFARTASAGKPSAKWLKEAQKHVQAVGKEPFREVLMVALPLLSRTRSFLLNPVQYGPDPNLVLDNFNALTLKGLLWMVPLAADSALTRTLSGVVESALKKVPGVGPREPKIANAAVYALSQIDREIALSALARLSTTVTFKGTLKEVQKALAVVSDRLKVSPDELLDMGVPTLGFTALGERVEVLGDTKARLIVGSDGVKLGFSKGSKVLKSVPAAVKKEFADALKELKAAQKEAEQAVSALSLRLDGLMIQPRVWKGESWLERYLHHPLAGTVARRLIWCVDGQSAFYSDGEMRDLNGQAMPVQPESEVNLWHPIGRSVEEVLAWRARLEALEVRQPFKQAWREVYVLTDAERRTATYSNRFAGHILKQHQFNQLAALRGWRNKLRLMVDDSYPPAMRDLPAYGLRAEYWIEGIGENYGEDSTDSGTYLRVTTDQVRFYPLGAPENHAHAGGGGYSMWVNQAQQPVGPLPLVEIPPLVLSEILRDVDLFVGVASVGNDPTWQDGGPGGRFREYWQSYSFGELTETAKSRAEYLARLIPRLKIKDRLSLEGRFLKVRGDRRTYKIHLGSSNILMEPNDQYLCIIPGGKGDGLDVNFDGDRVLSLVLSKAFLLADDTHITDPVILNQLGR